MKVKFWHGAYYTVGGPLSHENLALNGAEIDCRSPRGSKFDKIPRRFSGLYVKRTMKVKFDQKQHLMGSLLHAKLGPHRRRAKVGTGIPRFQNSVKNCGISAVYCPAEATIAISEIN